MYITIDGGTTNTRVSFTCGGEVLQTIKIPLGAGRERRENARFLAELRAAIAALCQTHGMPRAAIGCGMLTSARGIFEVPHLAAPVGIADLHVGLCRRNFTELAPFPLYLVPGVKKEPEDPLAGDMMRGEETEVFGLSDRMENRVFLLPGSHSKLVLTDGEGRISDFSTMLTGEMTAVLAAHTILRESVDLNAAADPEALLAGYRCAHGTGLNAALFKVRVLDTLYHRPPEVIAGFFCGCVLASEIDRVLTAPVGEIVLAGQKQLREATASLLAALSDRAVRVADDQTAERATTVGMIRIFGYGGRANEL